VGPLLETHHRVTATWEFHGSAYASELKDYCMENELTFDDFVQISLKDDDLRFYGSLSGEYSD
jgi:hypothetical protein